MHTARLGLSHRLLRTWAHQDWIRFGLRDRLLRRVAHPDRRPAAAFEVPFFGLRYFGSLDSYIDWQVYFYGAYEKQEVLLLRSLARLRKDPVLLDVGANVGHHSLALSSVCAEVHAFEPYGPLCELMRLKLERSGAGNVHVHPVGLSNENVLLPYTPPTGANLGTGHFANEDEGSAQAPLLRVVRGDDFLANAAIRRVDIVKLDVEGFENKVLAGLAKTLREHRPTIFMEFSGAYSPFSSEAELRALLPAGYTIKAVLAERPLAGVFAHRKARLGPFDFDKFAGNVLLSP